MKKLLALVVAAGLLAGCASTAPYAAVVNGRRLSQRDLNRELEAIRANRDYLAQVEQGFANQGRRVLGTGRGTFDSVFVARVLNRRIAFELVGEEVRRRKLRITAADLRRFRSELAGSVGERRLLDAFPRPYREELTRRSAEVAALQAALSKKVDADAVKAFYERNPQMFRETCVRHILVDTKEKAADLKARVTRGEDFAALAKAESKDKQGPTGGSAARGGDLGCVTTGSFVPEFEQAMAALQPGNVSDPVQTQFGFHLIEITGRKVKSLEEATPDIRRRLESQSEGRLEQFVARALTRSKIVVNPRYGKFVRSGGPPGVRAPRELRPATGSPPGPAPEE